MKTQNEFSRGMKILIAVFIVGLFAAAYGAFKTYADQSQDSEDLAASGVETDADVLSTTEGDGFTDIRVSYDPPGDEFLEFAEVQDCSGQRYEEGLDVVRVIYLPDDPDTIRLAGCKSSFDSDKFPGIVGIGLVAFGLFSLWRTRKMWTA